MTSREGLDAELDQLAQMLPPWRAHLRHEAQFWPQFSALASRILQHGGSEDRLHVMERLDGMLVDNHVNQKDRWRFLSSLEGFSRFDRST